MTVAAVIVAAGRGVRMGAGRPKAFVRVGGETILERSVRAFASHPRIGRIVVAVADPSEAIHALGTLAARVVLVRGGAERQESVRAGLGAIPEDEADIVLVHDAARPLVGRELVDAVIEAAGTGGAAVPATALTSTVKRVAEDGRVEETVPRDRLRLAQTPQGFLAPILRRAYAVAARDGYVGTDDAALVERTGGRVRVVEGSEENIKITTPVDLLLAEAILERRGRGGKHR